MRSAGGCISIAGDLKLTHDEFDTKCRRPCRMAVARLHNADVWLMLSAIGATTAYRRRRV